MNKDKFQKKIITPSNPVTPEKVDGFKNPTLGNSFKKNHEDTIFQHTSIRNDYGFGTPPSTPILDFVVNGVEQHKFIKFVEQKVVSRDSLLQPQFTDQKENPDYKGPKKLKVWSIHTPIQDISMDWDGLKFENPSKQQKFLNNYYEKYTKQQIQEFSGVRTAGHLSEPHIYRNANYFLKNAGDNKAKHTLPFGLTEYGNDIIRYGMHLLSPRGIFFMGKNFLMQSFNQRAETGIFNPIGVLISRNNILRFKRIFDYDLSNANSDPSGDLKKVKDKSGAKALEFIKSVAGVNVTKYQDVLNAQLKDNEISFLQNHGFGMKAELPVPLFNQLAEVVGNAIGSLFNKNKTKEEEKPIVATQQTFVVGQRQVAPTENPTTTPSLATYKAKSYGDIGKITRGGFTNGKVNDGYTAKIKASAKRSVYISYGLGDDNLDKINQMDIQSGAPTEDDLYKDTKDFIPLYINILNTDETIVLRANVTDIRRHYS